MKLRLFALVVLAAFVATSAFAQQNQEPKKGVWGKIKSGAKATGGAIKDGAKAIGDKIPDKIVIGDKNEVRTDAEQAQAESVVAKNGEKSDPVKQDVRAPAIATPKRGQPAKFTVSMPPAEACSRVRRFMIASDIELENGDCTTGQISTRPKVNKGWLTESAKRVVVSFIDIDATTTEIRVAAMNKGSGYFSTNGGKQADEKSEGLNSKESVKMATILQDHLLGKPAATTAAK